MACNARDCNSGKKIFWVCHVLHCEGFVLCCSNKYQLVTPSKKVIALVQEQRMYLKCDGLRARRIGQQKLSDWERGKEREHILTLCLGLQIVPKASPSLEKPAGNPLRQSYKCVKHLNSQPGWQDPWGFWRLCGLHWEGGGEGGSLRRGLSVARNPNVRTRSESRVQDCPLVVIWK